MTIKDFAAHVGATPSQVRHAIISGAIPASAIHRSKATFGGKKKGKKPSITIKVGAVTWRPQERKR